MTNLVQKILNDLREKEPSFTDADFKKPFMVIAHDGIVELLPYQRKDAIKLLEEGKLIVPLWIDQIHSKLKAVL
ncbi:hypothetical protein [Cyanobacterium aponinum]|uniref:hypothetical protein n=1 Tax=Cyanobacterium aponinum TaxID=379064 RepID=UPI0002E4340E|nr:hypothetical protein [Cyanobacterium aponinum]